MQFYRIVPLLSIASGAILSFKSQRTISVVTNQNTITYTERNPIECSINTFFTTLSNLIDTVTITEDKTITEFVPCYTTDTSSSLSYSSLATTTTAALIESSTFETSSSTLTFVETQNLQPTISTSKLSTSVLTLQTSTSTETNTYTQIGNRQNSNNYTGDLFIPIDTSDISNAFPKSPLNINIPSCISNNGVPLQTNKFFTNFLLESQDDTVFVYPYSLNYLSTGMAVQHTDVNRRVSGTSNTNNPQFASYFVNPTKLNELIFSAVSVESSQLCLTNMRFMSANAQVKFSLGYIEFPIVQGMGFVTSIYHGALVAKIESNIGISEFESITTINYMKKYKVTLFDKTEWLLYASGFSDFTLKSDWGFSYIEASESYDNLVIQVCIAPPKELEYIYDSVAGKYITDANISGSSQSGSSAEYSFHYTSKGDNLIGDPLVFVFPHIVESMNSITSQKKTGLTLNSTTKGLMEGYITSQLTMVENLETNIQFLPWSENTNGKSLVYSSDQLKKLSTIANNELKVNIEKTVKSIQSTYFAAKFIDKFAYILLIISQIIKDESLTLDLLQQLKNSLSIFISNTQSFPFIYDTKFGGITISSSDPLDDFGSGYYNDQHFHYGYLIHAAAVIGLIDQQRSGTWVNENKWWVNSLIRNVANPSIEDNLFPVFRMFDWFSGHSWASGLFTAADGRNQESTSEDYNFAYAMKLWGRVQGDSAMETRGDLMISIMKRSMRKYYLYTNDNNVEPSNFIGNEVAGILFDNKIDYTTFFGPPDINPEFVHGIHMIPITPVSSRIRDNQFVQEEWDEQISTFIGSLGNGWLGILKLNQALINPQESYNFFTSLEFDPKYLDDGLSRTWCVAFSAGLLNAT